ncbi:MAG: hypothetical protein NC412_00155 [Roseburia sp.]|nr:hypothetical protein [Roseburia sp.]MCM1277793.1 hypothetical protein [Robinsoniella sp.]
MAAFPDLLCGVVAAFPDLPRGVVVASPDLPSGVVEAFPDLLLTPVNCHQNFRFPPGFHHYVFLLLCDRRLFFQHYVLRNRLFPRHRCLLFPYSSPSSYNIKLLYSFLQNPLHIYQHNINIYIKKAKPIFYSRNNNSSAHNKRLF